MWQFFPQFTLACCRWLLPVQMELTIKLAYFDLPNMLGVKAAKQSNKIIQTQPAQEI